MEGGRLTTTIIIFLWMLTTTTIIILLWMLTTTIIIGGAAYPGKRPPGLAKVHHIYIYYYIKNYFNRGGEFFIRKFFKKIF